MVIDITPAEVFSKLQNLKNVQIIDVRTKGEFVQGKIPGSINIPLDVLLSQKCNLDYSSEIIFVCASGSRSRLAVHLLNSKIKNCYNLEGGVIAWYNEGYNID